MAGQRCLSAGLPVQVQGWHVRAAAGEKHRRWKAGLAVHECMRAGNKKRRWKYQGPHMGRIGCCALAAPSSWFKL